MPMFETLFLCFSYLFSVHLGGGFWGVLSVPIFNKESGIFYAADEHSFRLFGWNLLGVIVILAWSSVLAFILFIILRLTKQLRVSEEIELKGEKLECKFLEWGLGPREDLLGGLCWHYYYSYYQKDIPK